MAANYGAPRAGWAKLVCQLLVEDLETSLAFWTKALGFEIAHERSEGGLVYLERPEGAQIILCRRAGQWETAPLERPFGRGAMAQILVDRLELVLANLALFDWPLYAGPREVWRRYDGREAGRREICVKDPDGYLVMIAESIGERPARSS